MQILIYEPEFGGHRLSGVRVLMEALLELEGDQTVAITLATTEQAPDSEEFNEQLGHLCSEFELTIVDDFGLGTRNFLKIAFRKARMLSQLARSLNWDHIYVPYGDGLFQLTAFLFRLPGFRLPVSIKVETILMRCVLGYSSAATSKRLLSLLQLKISPFTRIHLIDPLPHKYIIENNPKLLNKVSLLPDPISKTPQLDKNESREGLGLPKSGRIVGCLGRIDSRKGAGTLVKAFLNAELDSSDFLLLAGKHSEEMVKLIASEDSERIISIDRYLTEDEMMMAFSALDVVATLYQSSFIGSASVAIRAASANRICMGSNQGWMGYVIPRFELGLVCNVDSDAELAETMKTTLGMSNDFELSNAGAEFVSYGSMNNIRANWTALIRDRLGLQQDVNKISWPK